MKHHMMPLAMFHHRVIHHFITREIGFKSTRSGWYSLLDRLRGFLPLVPAIKVVLFGTETSAIQHGHMYQMVERIIYIRHIYISSLTIWYIISWTIYIYIDIYIYQWMNGLCTQMVFDCRFFHGLLSWWGISMARSKLRACWTLHHDSWPLISSEKPRISGDFSN